MCTSKYANADEHLKKGIKVCQRHPLCTYLACVHCCSLSGAIRVNLGNSSDSGESA